MLMRAALRLPAATRHAQLRPRVATRAFSVAGLRGTTSSTRRAQLQQLGRALALPCAATTAVVGSCALTLTISADDDEAGEDGEEEQAKAPLARIQASLDASSIPINLKSGMLINLMLGGGVILYWSAMWNLLDEYFLKKRVPHKGINAMLRLGMGLFLLWLPDGDIKELGDFYEEDLEESFGHGEDGEEEEGASGTLGGLQMAGLRALLDQGCSAVLHEDLAEIYAANVLLAVQRQPDFFTKERFMVIFDDADLNGDGSLDREELKLKLDQMFRDFAQRVAADSAAAEAAAAAEAEEEEAEAAEHDRFKMARACGVFACRCPAVGRPPAPPPPPRRARQAEDWMEEQGLSLDLHNNFFNNLWLGTGIIMIWSGIEVRTPTMLRSATALPPLCHRSATALPPAAAAAPSAPPAPLCPHGAWRARPPASTVALTAVSRRPRDAPWTGWRQRLLLPQDDPAPAGEQRAAHRLGVLGALPRDRQLQLRRRWVPRGRGRRGGKPLYRGPADGLHLFPMPFHPHLSPPPLCSTPSPSPRSSRSEHGGVRAAGEVHAALPPDGGRSTARRYRTMPCADARRMHTMNARAHTQTHKHTRIHTHTPTRVCVHFL